MKEANKFAIEFYDKYFKKLAAAKETPRYIIKQSKINKPNGSY